MDEEMSVGRRCVDLRLLMFCFGGRQLGQNVNYRNGGESQR